MAEHEAMMHRYYEWTRRASASPPLGSQVELWQLVPDHPAAAWVRNRLTSLGHPATDADVAFYLSKPLLKDVLHAAGAAEYTANRVQVAVAAVVDFVEKELRHTWSDKDLANLRLAHPLVDYAYIEWSSLLDKLTALMNRVHSQDANGGGSGLILALKPACDPRLRIEAAFGRLTSALDRDRSLACYSRYLRAPANPTLAARFQWGRVILPIPSMPAEPVCIVDQFTWAEGRDVLTFARDGMSAVAAFVEDLLAAFESATSS